MDKSCGESTVTTSSSSNTSSNSNNRDMYLKHLNKISHKITKPVRRPPLFENQNQNQSHQNPQTPLPPPQAAATGAGCQPQNQNLQQHQPPVYNINKSDFRDVVQKLTGSPAHERFSNPPPIQQPKPPSSRLQRIRPPPLAQICNRPPPLLNCPTPPLPNPGAAIPAGGQRPMQVQPLSPLPPFPSVHTAAESPISAYMRFLKNSISSSATDSDPKRFPPALSPLAPLASPRWQGLAPPPPQLPPPPQANQNIQPPPSSSTLLPQFPALPSSPLPFGCLPSPRSPYALLSPGLLLSPTAQLGFQQLPLSPTVPVPSPTWKGI